MNAAPTTEMTEVIFSAKSKALFSEGENDMVMATVSKPSEVVVDEFE